MQEYVANEVSQRQEGFSCVEKWDYVEKRYIEMKGEVYPTFEAAQERARQLNEENRIVENN